RDRSGGYADIDLMPILKNDEELLKNYYAKELKDNHIQVRFVLPESKLMVHGNGELLSKTMMSILANAVYAITRKVQHQVAFAPEISVTATT
ncbi:A10/OS-D family protein, partial [Klebsiella pneumoniae]|nr:A10/OS-D family protein [Klebsiella pneumoniae]